MGPEEPTGNLDFVIGVRLDISGTTPVYGGGDVNVEMYCTPADIAREIIPSWYPAPSFPPPFVPISFGKCGYFLNIGYEAVAGPGGLNLNVRALVGEIGFPDKPGAYIVVFTGESTIAAGFGIEGDVTWGPADGSWVLFVGGGAYVDAAVSILSCS